MKYQGYAARIEYDAHNRIFVGHLAGVRDIVGFHGESVEELETAFHEAVDNYLAACAKLGQQPNKPVTRCDYKAQTFGMMAEILTDPD